MRWALGVTGMIGVINSVVAAVLAGLAADRLGATAPIVAWIVGGVAFALSLALLRTLMLRSQRQLQARLEPEFLGADLPPRGMVPGGGGQTRGRKSSTIGGCHG